MAKLRVRGPPWSALSELANSPGKLRQAKLAHPRPDADTHPMADPLGMTAETKTVILTKTSRWKTTHQRHRKCAVRLNC